MGSIPHIIYLENFNPDDFFSASVVYGIIIKSDEVYYATEGLLQQCGEPHKMKSHICLPNYV